jgi:hypothetical protein
MGGTCNTHGENYKCVIFWIERPEGNRSLGKPRRRCKDRKGTDRLRTGFNWLRIGVKSGPL